MKRKVIIAAAILIAAVFVLYDPAGAANVTKALIGGILSIFDGLARFLAELVEE